MTERLNFPTEHPNLKLTDNDRLQLRIDALSSPVRNYFVLGEALKSKILEPQDLRDLQDARLASFNQFTPEHIAELGSFILFRDSLKIDKKK